MNLTQLQYFSVIAQMENVSKAAEYLHITQSSLSKHLSRIEEEVGAPLFDRHGKKLVLNERGTRFLESCERILKEMEEAEQDIRQLSSGAGQKVKIALAGGMEELFACMAQFRKQNGNVEFDVDSKVDYADYVDINAYDVIVYPDEPRFRRFKGYDFCTEQFYLAEGKGTAEPSDYVFLCEGDHREIAYSLYSSAFGKARSESFVNSRDAHLKMIASGLAAGFVPEGVADFYQNSKIVLTKIEDTGFSRKLKICFKREKHLSAPAKAFRTFVLEWFQITPDEQ